MFPTLSHPRFSATPKLHRCARLCHGLYSSMALVGAVLLILYAQNTLQPQKTSCERSRITQRVVAQVIAQEPTPPTPFTTYQVYSEQIFNCTLEYQPHPLYQTLYLYSNSDSTLCSYDSETTKDCDVNITVFIVGMALYFFVCIIGPCYSSLTGRVCELREE